MKKILVLVLIGLFVSSIVHAAVIKDVEWLTNPATNFYTGQVTQDMAIITFKQLSADSYETRFVTMVILPTNKGDVYIGTANATAKSCFIMSKDGTGVDSIELPVDNVQRIYIRGQQSGDGVAWIAPKLL